MAVNIVLISTYELGRQPFGLASPAAWLRKRGHNVVALDLARQSLDEAAIGDAELIAVYLPMHTATRLAAQLIPLLRKQNPGAHLCCYGLYAPMNADYLRGLGVSTILGGEFEEGLAHLAERLATDGKQAVEQAAAASIFAGMARSCRFTKECFESSAGTWCSKTFAAKWLPGRNTSPSAIRISLTAFVTRWNLWKPFIGNFRP